MAIKDVARGISLSYTDGTPTTITSIQSYETNTEEEVEAFLTGTSRVNSHYKALDNAFITITTADIASTIGLAIGAQVTAVELTLEAAVDSAGASEGGQVKVALSHAVLESKGAISHENANSAPATRDLTFRLSRHPGQGSDPTYTITEVA